VSKGEGEEPGSGCSTLLCMYGTDSCGAHAAKRKIRELAVKVAGHKLNKRDIGHGNSCKLIVCDLLLINAVFALDTAVTGSTAAGLQ